MNDASRELDRLSVAELLVLMNGADAGVPAAVAAAIPAVTRVVEVIVPRIKAGGRLIYVGAGSSGRLGALDAAECPPTFGIDAEIVRAVLAGGPPAMWTAVEGAEDDPDAGAASMDELRVGGSDAVIGIAASATTPFTAAALRRSRQLGALTIAFGCRLAGALYEHADLTIAVDVGPEVLRGSTRLKAGTAQKLVLNMISTAVMTQLGHVYGDLMVDVWVTNAKLRRRAIDIVGEVAAVTPEEAAGALAAAGDSPKTAIAMLRRRLTRTDAEAALAAVGGDLRALIG